MTRKILSAVLCLCLLCSIVPLHAQAANPQTVKATIPDYNWELNGLAVDYKDSLYPVLNYNGVTYLPMTWGYCEYMGLRAIWVEGEGLFIAYANCNSSYPMPTYDATSNTQTVTATVVSYPVYINGTPYDNATETYPLLNFRDITYLPMTWRLAHEEFNWSTDWDDSSKTFAVSEGVGGDYSGAYEIYDMDASYTYFVRYMTHSYIMGTDEYGGEMYGMDRYQLYYRMDNKTGVLEEMSAPTAAYSSWDGYAWNYGHVDTVSSRKIEILDETVYTDESIPPPYTPFEQHAYVVVDGTKILIGEKMIIDRVYEAADGSIYLNALQYSGYRGTYNPNALLFRVSSDGTVTNLTDTFPDYKSMRIIGRQNNSLVLKCEMGSPELLSVISGIYEISPYNDGYYLFDLQTNQITRMRRYIKTDLDFCTPDGQVYSVINWKNTIMKTF